jgi:hypothetical protein
MTFVSINKLLREAKPGIATGSISMFCTIGKQKREIYLPDYPNPVNVKLKRPYLGGCIVANPRHRHLYTSRPAPVIAS